MPGHEVQVAAAPEHVEQLASQDEHDVPLRNLLPAHELQVVAAPVHVAQFKSHDAQLPPTVALYWPAGQVAAHCFDVDSTCEPEQLVHVVAEPIHVAQLELHTVQRLLPVRAVLEHVSDSDALKKPAGQLPVALVVDHWTHWSETLDGAPSINENPGAQAMHVSRAPFEQQALPPLVVPAQSVTAQAAASALPAIMARVAVKKCRQDGAIKSNSVYTRRGAKVD